MLRVFFSLNSFLVIFLLASTLFHNNRENKMISCKFKVRTYQAIYSIAIISSLAVLYFPPIRYDLNDMWMFFTSLNLSEIVRMISGYYILTVFPGYVIYRTFLKNKLNNGYEKLSVVLALSYVISIVISLFLSHVAELTVTNYLYILWTFVLVCETLYYLSKQKHCGSIQRYAQGSLIEASLMVSICLLLVFSSYLITLSSSPTGYALGGDIAKYVSVSNAFVKNHHFDAPPYIWFQVFIGIASVLTGLHPLYALVGLQFLIILFPLSFYTLMLRFFNDRKLAIIGTAITTITGGLTWIGILGLFQEYNTQNLFSTLWNLRARTQNWPWLSNHFFIVPTMDWSLLMLAFAFIYVYIVEGKQLSRLSDLVLGSLFLASTPFTHNVVGIIIFIMSTCIFSFLHHGRIRRIIMSFIITFLIMVIFDVLSYNFLINTVTNYYLHYSLFFASSLLFPYQSGIIFLLALSLLLPLIFILMGSTWRSFEFIKRVEFLRSISLICIIIVLVLSVVSIVMIYINFNALNSPEETIFPWYIYVLSLTPFFQLGIISILPILKISDEKRLGAQLMVSWIISAFLAIGLNMLFPRFATPVLVNRILMSAYLPLGALSTLTLAFLAQAKLPEVKLRFREIYVKVCNKKILVYFLMTLVGSSFLSHAYSIEHFYQGNMNSSISNEEKSLYEYLASLPPEKTFLTYSYPAYVRISSLSTHKTYACYQYDVFTSWSVEILFHTSSPEVAYYFLYKLGITHIIFTKQDLTLLSKMTDSALVSMLNFLPVVFNNSFAIVYSVPHYICSELSNYILVKPETYYSPAVFNESLIYDSISSNNLRIVGGSSTFRVENDTIVQEVPNIKAPSAQYLQLYKGISIPTVLSPVVSFRIRGTENALFTIGFYDAKKGWYWLSKERGLPSNFFNASNDWAEIKVDLSSILGKDATILYIDFVATSVDGSPARVEWKDFKVFRTIRMNELASSLYKIAYNALTIGQIPFTVIEDYKITKLVSSHVYIFPFSLPDSISGNSFIDYVATGSHVIILYDSTISNENMYELLNSLGIESGGISSANGIKVNNEIFNFPSDLYVANLTINSPYYYKIISHYSTYENKIIPFTVLFKIGNGSVIFVNMPKAFTLDRTIANIVVNAIERAAALLPKPIASSVLRIMSYPPDLFELGNPCLINIYKLKGLNNYIYTFSNINLKGNVSMSSDYIILNVKDITIKKLVLQNATHQEILENISLTNLCISGPYNTTLVTQDAIVYNLGDELPVIETSLSYLRIYIGEPAIKLKTEQNGREKTLTISRSYVEFEFYKDVMTNLRLQKPLIVLDGGSLNTSWKGVFWHNGKMFTTVATAERFPIIGHYSFQIINDNLLLINNIQTISVEIRPTKYWKSE